MPETIGNAPASPQPVFDGHLVVVGGGHAGAVAAHAARRANPHARITLVGEERHWPYERPALSKEVLLTTELQAPNPKFSADSYTEARIEVHQGVRVEALDCTARTLHAQNGGVFEYDRLVLATGSRVRPWPAGPLSGPRVHELRSFDDARRLHAALQPGRHLAVVGAGFIGLEVAAAARERGAQVTVIDRAATVLSRVMPPEVSDEVAALHRERGVDLRLAEDLQGIDATDHGVTLRLGSGTLHADDVLVGIGIVANVELAQAAGLTVGDGLIVDTCGRTSDPNVFGAGEVTCHPVGGVLRRIESWQVAELQAAAAGATAAGVDTPYDAVPWFWSDQFGVNYQVVGELGGMGALVRRGDPSGPHSVIRLDGEQRVVGAMSVQAPQDMAALRRMVQRRVVVDAALLADATQPLRQWLTR